MAVSAYWEASKATGVNGNQNDESIPQAGAVYVFTRTGTTWTQQAYIKASNTGEAGTEDKFGDGDQFGVSIALSDDGRTLAVGAISEDSNAAGINGDQANNSATSAGAVYVFARTGSTWTQQAYVKASNTGEAGTADAFGDGDQFGFSIALSADWSVWIPAAFSLSTAEVVASARLACCQTRAATPSTAASSPSSLTSGSSNTSRRIR